MGEVHVHEFMTFDGVIDAPTWTVDYGFDARMADAVEGHELVDLERCHFSPPVSRLNVSLRVPALGLVLRV